MFSCGVLVFIYVKVKISFACYILPAVWVCIRRIGEGVVVSAGELQASLIGYCGTDRTCFLSRSSLDIYIRYGYCASLSFRP